MNSLRRIKHEKIYRHKVDLNHGEPSSNHVSMYKTNFYRYTTCRGCPKSIFAGTRLPSYSYYTQSPQTRIGRKLQSWKLLQSGTTQHVDGIALSVPIIKCSNIQTNRNKSIKCGTPYRKCPKDRQLAPYIDSSWFSVNSVKLSIAASRVTSGLTHAGMPVHTRIFRAQAVRSGDWTVHMRHAKTLTVRH